MIPIIDSERDWIWDFNGLFDRTGKTVEEKVDYLSRADKILTLKRVVKRKTVPIMAKLNPSSNDFIKDFMKITKKIIIQKMNDENFCVEMEQLGNRYLDDVSFVEVKSNELTVCENSVIWKTSKKGYVHQYKLTFSYAGKNRLVFMTEKGCLKRGDGAEWVESKNRKLIGYTYDIFKFFGELMMLDYINQELENDDEGYYEMSAEEILNEKRQLYMLAGDERKYPASLCNMPVFDTRKAAEEVLGKNLACLSDLSDGVIGFMNNGRIPVCGFDDGETVAPLINVWRVYRNFRDYRSLVETIIQKMAFRYYAEDRNRIARKNEAKDYARSYETKRNIPGNVVKAMEQSGFNDFFGFVEFDELTELGKIEEIEKEFRSFNIALFGRMMQTSNVALRFRRLGNHKAAGLYYPSFNCICIDIGNPSSFVHEYGHMMDYTLGGNGIPLSEGSSFRQLFFLYTHLLDEDIKKSGRKLSGKYDLKYYKTPTEVFARCFEMYVKKRLGMDNSIIGECDTFAYPKSELLDEKISDYFTEILGMTAKGGALKCASV